MNIKRTLFVITGSYFIMVLPACSFKKTNYSGSPLCRKWKISGVSNITEEPVTGKDSAGAEKKSGNTPEVQEVWKSMSPITIQYNDDGTYEAKVYAEGLQTKMQTGTWQLIDGNKKIVQSNDAGKNDTLTIVSLSAGDLEIKVNDGNGGVVNKSFNPDL